MAFGDPSERPTGLGAAPRPWWTQLVRRKGHLGPVALTVLTAVAALPFLFVVARMLAWPGAESVSLPGAGLLRPFGELLDQRFSLQWVPPSDRSSILYILLLPTGAMLIAITRLTLGVRVLGLRAILIAIGIQATGLGPSLVLMAVVITLIVIIRPWTRRIRLPLYARIALILSLSSVVMVGALLVAPWLGSEAVWGVAFFPVIIMAMMADGVARTIEKDSKIMAAWRAGWTILLALFVALVDEGASRLTYRFPELMLTQLVSIVFISEFFDLRLLEPWPDRLSRYFAGVRPWMTPRPKVAVVRNRDTTGVIGRLGRPVAEARLKQSVQRQVNALRDRGFQVKVLEGDVRLLRELEKFLPPDSRSGAPGGIVLNLAPGLQGEARNAHVPAMLELAGVPYTGPDPTGAARLSDRFALMTLLDRSGVTVPRHAVVPSVDDTPEIGFPCAVRPRFEPDVKRMIVRNADSLRAAAREFRRVYGQESVVEEVVSGREIRVSVLGNDPIECLPLLDYTPGRDGKQCPADLPKDVAARARAVAREAFLASGCRDYGRVDLRLDDYGEPTVVNVQWTNLFAGRGSFMIAASAAGYDLTQIMWRIVHEAARRYVVRSPGDESSASPTVVSLAERRAAAG